MERLFSINNSSLTWTHSSTHVNRNEFIYLYHAWIEIISYWEKKVTFYQSTYISAYFKNSWATWMWIIWQVATAFSLPHSPSNPANRRKQQLKKKKKNHIGQIFSATRPRRRMAIILRFWSWWDRCTRQRMMATAAHVYLKKRDPGRNFARFRGCRWIMHSQSAEWHVSLFYEATYNDPGARNNSR